MPLRITLIIITLVEVTKSEYCLCLPFWQCKEEDSNLDPDYVDTISLRRLQASERSKTCPGFFDVCCKVRCGQRGTDNLDTGNLNFKKRISGAGNEAKFAEFPWMLGIILENSYRCGGSLIHPKAALTAAHCVQIKGKYIVRAGEYNWEHTKEPLKHQDRNARKVIIHPEYDPLSLRNDIAILILKRQFQISENIGVICLPTKNTLSLASLQKRGDVDCLVSGWGRDSYNKNKYQSVLKSTDLPIVDRNSCARLLQDALLGPNFFLDHSFICAGGTNKDTCKGDGGSPLVCSVNSEEGRYQQIGIVSWGLTCGIQNAPGVYVNLILFVDWIDRQMFKYHLDSRIYKY